MPFTCWSGVSSRCTRLQQKCQSRTLYLRRGQWAHVPIFVMRMPGWAVRFHHSAHEQQLPVSQSTQPHPLLNIYQIGRTVPVEKWMWLCALAYWQLLLMRTVVKPDRPAWHPHHKDGYVRPLTPAQVQRSALAFLLQSGTPARNTRPTGKGHGRQRGYRPAPRMRYEVVFKAKKRQNQPAVC